MPEFAPELVTREFILDPGAAFSFRFGPPTQGRLSAIVAASIYVDPEELPDDDDLVGSDLEGPTPILLEGQPQIPGTSAGPSLIIPRAQFQLLLVGSGQVQATAQGQLQFDVPALDPVPATVWQAKASAWELTITNNSQERATCSIMVRFLGVRPLVPTDINLDLLNEKLDLLFNAQQPFTLRFRSELQPPSIQFTTHVEFEVTEEWQHVVRSTSASFDGRVFIEPLESSNVTLRATVVDGAFAIRLRVGFKPGARIDADAAIRAWVDSFFLDLIAGLANADILLREVVLDIFFILRPRGRYLTTSFEVLARPTVFTPGDDIGRSHTLLEAVVRWLIEDKLARGMEAELRDYAKATLTWLLGEHERDVYNSDQELELHYAADLPDVVTLPSAPPRPSLDPGELSKIDHIVVIMMENRSFDHMLGFLSLPSTGNDLRRGAGRSDVDGLTGDETNPATLSGDRARVFPLSAPRSGAGVRPTVDTRGTLFPHNPGHDFGSTKRQRGCYVVTGGTLVIPSIDRGTREPEPDEVFLGKNEGFVFDFGGRLFRSGLVTPREEEILRGDIMGYHPAEHVPAYAFLAEQFGICDRWFASFPGHTWPNRYVTLTGALSRGHDGQPQLYNPVLATYDPIEVPTIFDHLAKAGVTWRYYEHDVCMLRAFSAYTFDDESIVHVSDPTNGFYAAAAAGTLPSVSFVEPDLTDVPPGNDDNAPSDIANGQALIRRVYDAIAKGPAWDTTLLMITYDEHGGFFDHVYPEPQPLFDATSRNAPGFASLAGDPDPHYEFEAPRGRVVPPGPIDYYGMRVPAFVVSAWTPPRSVSHEVFDHASIAKTIMARFLSSDPPDMGLRVDLARDVGEFLSLSAPRRAPEMPSVFGARPPSLRAVLRPSEEDDFHAFMGALARRFRPELLGRR